jgi:hypothetical protein
MWTLRPFAIYQDSSKVPRRRGFSHSRPRLGELTPLPHSTRFGHDARRISRYSSPERNHVKQLIASTIMYFLLGVVLIALMAAGFALSNDLSQFRYTVF